MKHNRLILLVTIFALGLWLGDLAAQSTVTAAEKTRPNVLMIFVDDLRPSLGCYGDPLAKSPNIDRLAKESRLFRRAYCHQSVCGPSRASILTGLLPDHTGVWHNRNHFRTTRPSLVTLPELFKQNGYHTQGLGKIFSGDEREEDPQSWTVPTVFRAAGWKNYTLPENRGIKGKGPAYEMADVSDEGYTDGKLAKLAIEALENFTDQEQPFFLAVGFFKPHLPFNAPKKYWDLYDSADITRDRDHARTIGAPQVAYPDHLELAGYHDIPKDERLDDEQSRRMRHGYYACVSYTDAQIGKVLDALQNSQLGDDTIVVLLGDHGYSLGEADHWCKDTNFELDTHVPLMIRTPSMNQPGVGTAALTEYVDLYPTLAELAGLTLPSDLDGHSLVPVLSDPERAGRELVLSQFSRPFRRGTPEIMGYSIRTEQQRYTRWIDWASKAILSEELYDYAASESVRIQDSLLIERQNLANDPEHAELRQIMSKKLDQTLLSRVNPVSLPSQMPKKKATKKGTSK